MYKWVTTSWTHSIKPKNNILNKSFADISDVTGISLPTLNHDIRYTKLDLSTGSSDIRWKKTWLLWEVAKKFIPFELSAIGPLFLSSKSFKKGIFSLMARPFPPPLTPSLDGLAINEGTFFFGFP